MKLNFQLTLSDAMLNDVIYKKSYLKKTKKKKHAESTWVNMLSIIVWL